MDTQGEIQIGTHVIYGLHGKCNVIGIEERIVSGSAVRFYRLEPIRNNPVKTQKVEPAIWIPVQSAKGRGLRAPINQDQSTEIFAILNNKDHYFNTADNWSVAYPKLETAVRTEGAMGLAKVLSYLHMLKKKHVVLPTEIARFYETITKLLFRELGDSLTCSMREIEERVNKALKNKQTLDQ